MKHYKDPNTNEVYAYEADGSQDEFIKEGLIAITNEEANTICAQQQTDLFAVLSYAEKRKSEYPPITDYLDGVVKGDQAQIDKYIADCLAVKIKYPKGV
jgi:hypothetical protein